MRREVWINYTTFIRDFEWLEYSLKSFRKYCKGFAGITIVVPDSDVKRFIHLEEKYGTKDCPVLIKNFMEYPGKGFVHHLAMKCYADVFSPTATHILHMDPDCMWSKPTTPDDYFVDGKPVLVIEPYDAVQKYHGNRYNWKFVTQAALGFECTHETMCRHPAIHHSFVYKAVREHIESIHPTPFIDFVLKQKNSYPQGFGEFNTLGSYVVHKTPDKYHLIDRGDRGEAADPESHVAQMWSYTGVHNPNNQKIIRELLK